MWSIIATASLIFIKKKTTKTPRPEMDIGRL